MGRQLIELPTRLTNNAEQLRGQRKGGEVKCEHFTKFCAGLHEIFGFHGFNLSSFVICYNVTELILPWQNIKICTLCWNLPWNKTASPVNMQTNHNQLKSFQNIRIFRELNNVTLAELLSKFIRPTLVYVLFIASWITAHLACNSCRSTTASTSTSNNQVRSIKSERWWSADIPP